VVPIVVVRGSQELGRYRTTRRGVWVRCVQRDVACVESGRSAGHMAAASGAVAYAAPGGDGRGCLRCLGRRRRPSGRRADGRSHARRHPATPETPRPVRDDRRLPAEYIHTGRLQPGDQLPTVVQLAAQHSVVAGTAHRAIATLATEGLIVVSRGKRAVVASESDALRAARTG
jgi:hypothetical protein